MQIKSRLRSGSGSIGASLLLAFGSWGCALSDGELEEGELEGVGTSARELEADLVGPFAITITPPSRTIVPADFTFYNVQVDPLEGFSGDVSLDVTTEPSFNGFVQLAFGSVTPPGQDFLDVQSRCDTQLGTYDLIVTGTGDDGTTATATATVTVDPITEPPLARFNVSREGFTVRFFDSSFPATCLEIVSWEWDFGDGGTSTERNPFHTYAVRGDYTVTLTVTDSQGLSGTVSETVQVLPPPPVLEIDRVTRIRERFEFRVDLVWSGAEGDLVELHRNFNIVDLPDNDGAHRDRFRSLQTSFRWFVCELGIDQCSNEVVLDVGGPNSFEATVTTEIAGQRVVAKVPIDDE
jgi:PKD repeat protein